MRTILALAMALAACGSDATTNANDMTMPADLASTAPSGCGIENPPSVCPGLTPSAPGCYICDYGSPPRTPGRCARACNVPSDCDAPATCVPFSGDGGMPTVQMGGCLGFSGLCR